MQPFPIAVRALLRNKTRSFLTMLGVIIGVGSVISMVAVGEGAKSSVSKAFEQMGTNLLIVTSGSTRSGGFMGGMGSMPTLTWDDLDAIRSEAPSVRYAAPLMSQKTSIVGEDGNWNTQVNGTTPEYFPIRSWRVAEGSMFSASDIETNAKVVVLGQTVVSHVFGTGVDPVGKPVRIRGTPYQVIGILEKKGQSFGGTDLDDAAFVPISVFRGKLQGGLQQFITGVIFVGAGSAEETFRAQNQISSILADRHHIADRADDDFAVRNLTEIASARQQGMNTLTGLLAAIAVVSLLVGGIGIMNIMLVSVTERTREIGIRMAVGARPVHIMAQFLVEAMTLSMTGGLLGIGLGFGVSKILADNLVWAFVVRSDIVAVAFLFSAAVGVVFGLYPARKAMNLDPIEALRYE
ncbi:MAG: ABC transporter permease [Deltaproteobacteria bacterium]|nr:ABC transporter permease [Deltaproteobacteria bacterium]